MIMIKQMSKGIFPVALICTLLAPLAQAMPEGGRLAQGEEPRRGAAQQPPDFQREASVPFQRHNLGYSGDSQRTQRLSPEERRQLRRDIHEAGRDIYPPRR